MRTVELTVCVHVDLPGNQAVLVSDDGEEKNAHWIPRSLIVSLCPTGRTTKATRRDGSNVKLATAVMDVAEFKAKQLGLI